METYYSNMDLSVYSALLANYHTAEDAWRSAYEDSLAAWQAAHDAWEANPVDDEGNPLPEPQQPVPPPEPEPPAEPTLTYTATEAETAAWLTTAYGDVFVTPGRFVVASSDGAQTFAVSADELAADYTSTTDPLPT